MSFEVLPRRLSGKESACQCRRHKSHGKRWLPTAVFLPGKFSGQRTLAGCSPWGHNEFTEHMRFVHIETDTCGVCSVDYCD